MSGRLLPIIVASLIALPARADLAGHFGMNPRSMGMAGAYTAVAEDVAALYYNPAGLIQLEGLTVGAGMLAGYPLLSEDDHRIGMPEELSYFLHMGLPFSGKLKDHLALGVSLNMPWGRILQTQLYQKQDPYFVLYDASVRLLQLRLGGAVRIPWRPLSFLSLGASLQILGSVNGSIGFYAPYQRSINDQPADPDSRLEAWASMEVPTSTFFTGGALAEISENLQVGATYRSEQYISVRLPVVFTTRLAMSETNQITLPVEGVASFRAKYTPQQVSVGASYHWGRLHLVADVTWIDYSNFQPPSPTVTLDIEKLQRDPGVRLILGPDSTLQESIEPQVEWTDVVVPRVAAELSLLPWLTARGGYFYERSPLENTDFPIYDCDKHGITLGARGSFVRPWGLIPGRVNLDLGLEEILYTGRSILGSDVGGHVLAIAFGLEIVLL